MESGKIVVSLFSETNDEDFMSYGWLHKTIDKGGAYTWAGGASGETIVIDYGAPTGSGGDGSSVGVTAQWLFDEAASPIVDEVNSISKAQLDANTYNVTAPERQANLSPGITMGPGVFGGFGAVGVETALDLNQSDFVFECWFAWRVPTILGYLIDCRDRTGINDGWNVLINSASNVIADFKATDGTTLQISKDASSLNLTEGDVVKLRITGDRSGDLNIQLAGSDLGSGSLSTLSGKDIKCKDLAIGNNYLLNKALITTFYEMRVTVGNAINDSGDGLTNLGLVPASSFRVFSDGTITPTTGTAGTFTRTGVFWRPDTPTSLVKITSDNDPCENAVPQGVGATSSSRTGVIMPGLLRNETHYTTDFSQWTAIGTGSVITNQATAPDGNTTADQLTGSASGDGIKLSLTVTAAFAAGAWMNVWVWAKAVTGTPTIKMTIKDEDSPANDSTDSSHPNGFTVGSDWQLYMLWLRTVQAGVPPVGNRVHHIVVDSGDVYIWGAGSEFTGQDDTLDTNTPSTFLPYYADAGATRQQIETSHLTFTGNELTGSSVGKMTVSGWYYYPKTSHNKSGNDHSCWIAEKAVSTTIAGVRYNFSTHMLGAYFASASITDSTLDPLQSSFNRWVNYTLSLASGNSALYIDGVKVLTDSSTFADFQLEGFYPGANDGGNVSKNERFMWNQGQLDVWMGERLNDSQVSNHYAATAGTDKIPDPSPYYFPTAGATDVWRFDTVSGNITSLIVGDTYTRSGDPHHYVQGPNGLKGIYYNSAEYHGDANLGSELNIGAGDDFVFMVQLRLPKNEGDPGRTVVDFGTNFATAQGMVIFISSGALDFYVIDGTPTVHHSFWNPSGLIVDEDAFYTLRFVFNRSNTSARLYYKKEGETEVGPITMTQLSTAFSSLGAIAFNGDGVRFGLREDAASNPLLGVLFQAALAVGTTTYDATTKP